MPEIDLTTVLTPWFDLVHRDLEPIAFFDAHTHIGQDDPDGFTQSPDELLATLQTANAKGCFVFPMHEPGGYPSANDNVLKIAAAHQPLMIPFCRLDPHDDPAAEAERALAAGARGIKLHPRAEQFALNDHRLRPVFAIADERRLPILIHAGRGIPALGEHAVALATEFPGARLILAHAAVSDLAWLWRAAAELPNLLFDSAWWMPDDLLTLFTLVGPGQILFASDAPYGQTLAAATAQLRLARQAGLQAPQLRSFASEQSLRIAAAEPLFDAGPPPGERDRHQHLLLDRFADFIQLSAQLEFRGATEGADEMLNLARQACAVPPETPDAPIFAALTGLLDAAEAIKRNAPSSRAARTILTFAAAVSKTPDIPVP